MGPAPLLLLAFLIGWQSAVVKMAQRSPPAALLELQQNFPTMSITAFDGNWASYELQFLTAISRLPAVVGLVLGQFLRPTQEDAAAFIFPNVNGLSELPNFKRRQFFFKHWLFGSILWREFPEVWHCRICR